MKHLTVLTVDDSEDDTLLFQRACRKIEVSFGLYTVNDGQRGIDYISGADAFANRQQYPLPDLLLLDLKMPKKNGFEVLEWVREQSVSKNLPVIIFTSSENDGDIQQAYEKGANWYVMKPVNYNDLLKIANTINSYLVTSNSNLLLSLQNFRGSRRTT